MVRALHCKLLGYRLKSISCLWPKWQFLTLLATSNEGETWLDACVLGVFHSPFAFSHLVIGATSIKIKQLQSTINSLFIALRKHSELPQISPFLEINVSCQKFVDNECPD